MRFDKLAVRRFAGHCPRRGPVRSENIVAHVRQEGPLVEIRLEDEENHNAWFEITIELLRGRRASHDAGE